MKFMVAFSSHKRSAATIEVAANHAKAMGAELFIVRIIPDPEKVGVVAQLIATERPQQTAKRQVDETIAELQAQGLKATGIVKVGEVAPGIISTAVELDVDLVFIGTTNIERAAILLNGKQSNRALRNGSLSDICMFSSPWRSGRQN